MDTKARRIGNYEAYEALRNDMREALMGDPSTEVLTPSFGIRTPRMNACDVVVDHLATQGAEDDVVSLFALLRDAALGQDVKTRAELWLSVQAEKYAQHHCDDVEAERATPAEQFREMCADDPRHGVQA
jgi:hypothetical protein